jgi:hypothetical protein
MTISKCPGGRRHHASSADSKYDICVTFYRFAAVEKHRHAVQTWLSEEDDTRSAQMLKTAHEAWCAWLITLPTTIAGIHSRHHRYRIVA